MATKHSPVEINTDSEESDSDTEWNDSEEDPDYDALEETCSNLSNLSLKHKARARVVEDKGLGEGVIASDLNGDDFEKVQKLIEVGLLEKLKVDECKLYLRKNGLRLTGNKDTLMQRIKEHLEILNGGEKKYPPSSFVLNCKGDACIGDVVLFEQNVYEMFNIASRSASGPSCGKRIVAGHIVKESYGAAKQQHTFTIEVLWSKGEKPLPPLYPLLIKGRNLYRFKTMRQKWEDEAKRQKILMEKHSRGFLARADREARIKEKEQRKKFREDRVPKNDSARNQCQSHSHITRPQHHPQETNVTNNPEKPEFPSRNSGLSAHIRKETSSMVNKPAAVTTQHDKSVGNTFSVQYMHNQQAWNRINDSRRTFGIDHLRVAEFSANYNTGFTGLRVPLADANSSHPMVHNRESYKSKQLCRHYLRGRCYFGDNCKFLHDLGDKGNA